MVVLFFFSVLFNMAYIIWRTDQLMMCFYWKFSNAFKIYNKKITSKTKIKYRFNLFRICIRIGTFFENNYEELGREGN